MDLEQLRKKLYEPEGEISDRPRPPVFSPSVEPPKEDQPVWAGERPKKPLLSAGGRKKIWWTIFSAAALALGLAAGWWWYAGHSFDKNQTTLEIFGAERVVSGEEVNYTVRYKNNSGVILNDAVLTFYFPKGSLAEENASAKQFGDTWAIEKKLGNLAGGQEGQAEFYITVLGDKDSQQKFSAKLSYRPANVKLEYANEAEFASTIIAVPLVLSFDLPEKVVAGQTINFSLKYLNTSETVFAGAKIKIDFPDGFTFLASQPGWVEDEKLWDLLEISGREEGKILLSGTIAGQEGDNKAFKAYIGVEKNNEFVPYAQTVASPQIAVSPLWVEQSLVNNTALAADPGSALTYRLKYRNTTNAAIGPVAITVKIDSQAVDFANVTVLNGNFNSAGSTIVWNESSLPALKELAGGKSGELEFVLRVKDKLPIVKTADKNFIVSTKAKIDSSNVPLELTGMQISGENQLAVKINSRLSLKMKGFYSDNLLPNSGPIPPKVGQKTTYTVYWQVLNIANDLSGVTLEAYLPSYVQWENNVYQSGEDLKYDSASGKITWKIGKLSAGTGILLPTRTVTFQVGLVSSLSQVGQTVEIVKTPRVYGQDDFTGEEISATAESLRSDMPDDPNIGAEKGRITN
ncbi:MAG: hypothetical protein PHW33_01620 [Candidatus Portnoybacteria bacterium]|nr:hypothetical protein [Candidatus Portnoybacteria bacterium]